MGLCRGRFDGWLMRKHPDGQWVSVENLNSKSESSCFLQTAEASRPYRHRGAAGVAGEGDAGAVGARRYA